jgi:putative ABC transport system permease protein
MLQRENRSLGPVGQPQLGREIGPRRALGATRGHIAAQFVTESLVLAAIGGALGMLIGVVVTEAMARSRQWAVVIPPGVIWGAVDRALPLG